MSSLMIATSDGDVEIQERELSTITDEVLRDDLDGISREDLDRCFAEGVELMRGVEPGKRVRPIAQQDLNGEWSVLLVGYSAGTDPSHERSTAGLSLGPSIKRARTRAAHGAVG